MKTFVTLLFSLLLGAWTAQAQGLRHTTTLQGKLDFSGAPANGVFDLAYRLLNSPEGVDQSGPGHTNLAVTVNNGAFTTEIELPDEALDWAQQSIEIDIRPADGGEFQRLSPRLQITPVPASLVADLARTVAPGAIKATALGSNAVTTDGLADGAVTAAKVQNGQLITSLNGLTDGVTIEAGEGLILSTVGKTITLASAWCSPWCLYGNVGTTPAPPLTVVSTFPTHHFLGTRDNKALELRARRWRALRVEPTTANDAPNLLGGYGMNFADANAVGITIGGGGASGEPNFADVLFGAVPRYDTIGGGADNQVRSSSYATIGGGRKNTILFNPATGRGFFETISGGATNLIDDSAYASIGGGSEQRISNHSDFATVSGGQASQVVESRWGAIGGGAGHIQGFTPGGTIGGGFTNRMTPSGGLQVAYAPTISGGQDNWIFASSYAVIAGGFNNTVSTYSHNAAIGGGQYNFISYVSTDTTIGGGAFNAIGWDSAESTIGGGGTNVIENLSAAATIAGGRLNYIDESSPGSTISGGQSNIIEDQVPLATISGGSGNRVSAHSEQATIGGGLRNTVEFFSDNAVIGGGQLNTVEHHSDHGTISGGFSNRIGFLTDNSTIGGGEFNDISDYSNLATIGGGGQNKVGAELLAGTVAGGLANDVGAMAHYSTIGGGVENRIDPKTPSSVIAGGANNWIEFAPNDAVNTIGGGQGNHIRRGEYATIPGGKEAYARHYGQVAHASGSFASAGDAQHAAYVLRNSTASTNVAELFLDGSGKRLQIPIGSTWIFEVTVAARTADTQAGTSAGYHIRGVIKNENGTTTLVGPPAITQVWEDTLALPWNATAIADNANSSLSIQVQGALNKPVRWAATVRTTEVIFP